MNAHRRQAMNEQFERVFLSAMKRCAPTGPGRAFIAQLIDALESSPESEMDAFLEATHEALGQTPEFLRVFPHGLLHVPYRRHE